MNARFLIFVGIIQTLLFVGHALLYIAFRTLLAIPDGLPTTILQIGLLLLSVSFVSATIVAFRTDHPLARALYHVAAVWLGLLHLLILASIIAFVVTLPFPDWSAVLSGFIYSVAIVCAALGWFRARYPRVTNVTVNLARLPETWRHKQIVWISDIHLGHINGRRFAERVVRKINQLNPALVCIGGDLYDGGRIDIQQVTAPLRTLQATHGAVFVTGNHELFTDKTRFTAAVNEVGIRVLEDEKIDVEGLQVIGVDYRSSRSPERLRSLFAGMMIDHDRPSLLLTHSPDRLAIAEQAGITWQISGHTHRGQLWPFSLITRRVYRGFDYGLKQFGGMQVYTSSGTGTWGPPLRLGTRSEIVCFTLV